MLLNNIETALFSIFLRFTGHRLSPFASLIGLSRFKHYLKGCKIVILVDRVVSEGDAFSPGLKALTTCNSSLHRLRSRCSPICSIRLFPSFFHFRFPKLSQGPQLQELAYTSADATDVSAKQFGMSKVFRYGLVCSSGKHNTIQNAKTLFKVKHDRRRRELPYNWGFPGSRKGENTRVTINLLARLFTSFK